MIKSRDKKDLSVLLDTIGLKERICSNQSVLIKINLSRPPVPGHPRTDVALLSKVIQYIYSRGGTCALAEGAKGYLDKNLEEIGLSYVINRYQVKVIDVDLEEADRIIMNGEEHYIPKCFQQYGLRIALPAASKRLGMIFSNNVKLFVGAVPRSMYQINNQIVDWRPRVHLDLHHSVANIYRSIQAYAPFHYYINGGLAMSEDVGEFPLKDILIGDDGVELDFHVLKNYFESVEPPEYLLQLLNERSNEGLNGRIKKLIAINHYKSE